MRILGILAVLFLSTLSYGQTSAMQKHLDAYGARWQHRLKLDDWRIVIRVERLEKFEIGTNGYVQPDFKMRSAEIGLLDPKDYPRFMEAGNLPRLSATEVKSDMTFTLVHELVHLRVVELVYGDPAYRHSTEEFTVDRLTQALLGRGK